MSACTADIMINLQSEYDFYSFIMTQGIIVDPLIQSSHVLTAEDRTILAGIQTIFQRYKACLIEKKTLVSSTNTGNASKRSQILALEQTIKDRVLDVQISQDRALLVRHPEMSRSYYDGILSIGRPMAHYSVPILIGISTFLLSISLFIFLGLLNFDSRILLYVPIMNATSSSKYSMQFWIMSGIAVILLGLTIYAFTK